MVEDWFNPKKLLRMLIYCKEIAKCDEQLYER